MRTIPIKSVVITETRQRREFNADTLMELTESIRDRGLMHAPVLRQEDGKFILVAGERRVKAIQDLWALGGQFTYDGELIPTGSLPYSLLGELNELEAEEAELDENLRRDDLPWQDHAAAVQRLQALREKQAGLRGEIHTVAQTAKEITGRSDGAYQAKTRKEIIVAKHLHDPDVAKAKTLEDGFKILKKKEEIRKNAELSELVGLTFTADIHELFHDNCLKKMQEFSAESFDVICTDPPYGMGADSFGNSGGKMINMEHDYDDSYVSWVKLMAEWCPLSFRVAKPEAHAYVWCDIDNFHELKALMQRAGWYVFRTPLINVKTGSGRVPIPDRGPRRQYETCLYAIKGNKRVTHIYSDVIETSPDPNEGFGAQKPVALMQNLLQRSVKPGDTVLDCFAGTGPTFQAGHNLQCKVVGIEAASYQYIIALKRLEAMIAVI